MKKANVFAARLAVWVAALLLLLGLMWYVNQNAPRQSIVDAPIVDPAEDDMPIGYEE